MEVWELVEIVFGNFQSLMFGVGGRSRGDCGSELVFGIQLVGFFEIFLTLIFFFPFQFCLWVSFALTLFLARIASCVVLVPLLAFTCEHQYDYIIVDKVRCVASHTGTNVVRFDTYLGLHITQQLISFHCKSMEWFLRIQRS